MTCVPTANSMYAACDEEPAAEGGRAMTCVHVHGADMGPGMLHVPMQANAMNAAPVSQGERACRVSQKGGAG